MNALVVAMLAWSWNRSRNWTSGGVKMSINAAIICAPETTTKAATCWRLATSTIEPALRCCKGWMQTTKMRVVCESS